jgi:hypothetical protein
METPPETIRDTPEIYRFRLTRQKQLAVKVSFLPLPYTPLCLKNAPTPSFQIHLHPAAQILKNNVSRYQFPVIMYDMSRRPARNQPLPQEEADFLNALDHDARISRVYELYSAGWTLQAIGDALIPSRPRSTVRSWLLRFELPGDRKIMDAPIPRPDYKTGLGGYIRKRPISPGIHSDEAALIRDLAPIARTYRAKMPSNSSAAVANDQLTAICIRLHSTGVTVRELANAASVTYRAMAKRLGLTKLR